jgi:dihydropteroate synthase
VIWQTSRFVLDLTSPKIMGIVNLTPDSFSDGGERISDSEQIRFAENLLKQGADILDLGAESTRPGSTPVPAGEELARLAPVLREAVKWNVPISIDTYKPIVMQTALDMGADIINDVWALRQEGAVETVAKYKTCGMCIMHMNGEPTTMQLEPMQVDRVGGVVVAVKDFLSERSQILAKNKIAKNRIVWDVGIGFGKTPEQNFELLAKQTAFLPSGYPLLCAWSRKSSLGKVIGHSKEDPASERLFASVAAVVLAVERGARLVRVHDVLATKQALQVWTAAKKKFD